MNPRTIGLYVLAVVLVIILGAFSGWYMFLRTQSKDTLAQDSARGLETSYPASGNPSFLSNMLDSITGGGAGVSPSPTADFVMGENTQSNVSGSGNASSTAKRPPRLSHVFTKPTSGMSFVTVDGIERLRFVERATGYVYDADPETGIVTRVSNVLSPKIYETLVTPRGRVIQRFLNDAGDITSSVMNIATTSSGSSATTTSAASTTTLAKNVAAMTIDPRSDNIFYLVPSSAGAVGYRSDWNGAKAKQIFASAMVHWRPLWLNDGRIVLTQAAADNVPGFAYEITARGELRALVRGVAGLTLLPRASGSLLIGESTSGKLNMYAQVSPTTTVTRLSIQTVADKCVWAPDTIVQSTSSGRLISKTIRSLVAYCGVPQNLSSVNFLDEWYSGRIHTSDAMWRIDANAGTAQALYNPDGGLSIDVEKPTINNTGVYVAFANKTDASLWMLRIEK